MLYTLSSLQGIGNSGGDIAVELSRHASQVYLSTRRGAWVFSRMTSYGYPSDQYKNRRFFSYVPKFLLAKIGEDIANRRFDHVKFGLKPDYKPFQQHPMVNDDLPIRMAVGKLIVKPNVKSVKERSEFSFLFLPSLVTSSCPFNRSVDAFSFMCAHGEHTEAIL